MRSDAPGARGTWGTRGTRGTRLGPDGEPDWLADFERLMRRLDIRVRAWSATRWAAAGARGEPRSQVAHELAVTLALLARRAGSDAPDQTPPQLAPHAIADQLVVLGREFAQAPQAGSYAKDAADAVEHAGAGL